jgi:hypothetical protein
MRFYAWLLRVLPRQLREKFGEDMVQLFRDRLRDAGSRRARAALWAGGIADVLTTAITARVPRRVAAVPAAVRPRLGDLPMDVRLAMRALLRNPTYSVAAVVTLAVGIGTATAFFSVVYGVLLRPLPFRDADRLVSIWSEYPASDLVAQLPTSLFSVVIESTRQRPVTLHEVRDVVNRIDRTIPVLDFQTMREPVGWSVAAPRFQATLLTLLTVIGILLAATGCFAVLMQSVGRRTRELGVRMTLGATTTSVALLILRRALGLGATGTVIGVCVALAATRLIETYLYGVQRTDAPTFIAAAVLVTAVVAAAAVVPARRVARLDPVQALRHL